MSLKREIEVVMFNIVSGYAPTVGCELEERTNSGVRKMNPQR